MCDLFTFQSNEVSSSCAMEKEGLIRAINEIEQMSLEFKIIISDRHKQNEAWIRQNKPEVVHFFYIWHIAKGK